MHPDRVEVLSALALAARGREPLAAGFARIATDQPELRPWLSRLAPLGRGAEAVPLLRDLRLIDADQARWLARREGTERFAAGLDRVAIGGAAIDRSFALVRDAPVLLLLVAGGLPWLLWSLLDGVGYGLVQVELGLNFRLSTTAAFLHRIPWPLQAASLVGLVAVLWLVLRAWRYQPIIRYLLPLWCPSAWRAWLGCRLLLHAEAEGRRAPLPLGERWQRRLERLLRLPGSEPEAPAWRRDWRLYWFLTWFRVGRDRRALLAEDAQQVDLVSRLRVLGLIVDGPRGVDWDASLARAQVSLERAVARVRPWIWSAVAILTVFGFGRTLGAAVIQATVWWSGWAYRPPLEAVVVANFLLLQLSLVGSGVLALIVVQIPWVPSRLITWGHRRRIGATICAGVARCVRARGALGDTFDALAVELPWLYRWRLRHAAALAREGADPVTALARARALPPAVIRALRAGADLGPDALASACELEAAVEPQRHEVAVVMPYALAMVAIGLYLLTAVVPRFGKMLRSLRIDLPDNLQVLVAVIEAIPGTWPANFIVGMVLVLLLGQIASWSWGRWFPGSQRLRRGAMLLAGLAGGADEGRLARCLAATWSRPPPRLAAAGAAGDLPAILRCCGWSVSGATPLAVALGRARARRAALAEAGRFVLRLLLPLLLAVPVLLFLDAIFDAFVLMLRSVEWRH